MDGGSRPSGLRFLQNLSYLVSTAVGYKDPARRRNEDARFRYQLLRRIEVIRGSLDGLAERAAEEEARALLEQAAAVQRLLDRSVAAVRYRPAGSAAPFARVVLDDSRLDAILEIDLILFEDLERIEAWAHRQGLAATQSAPAIRLETLEAAIEQFEEHLLERDRLLGEREDG
ncbi:MAG: hypothetical protein GF346_02080 [Candidatus Eisenbacteria bacterium]|nr:hypothetical protein [Candidatus Latescibacterota bacterium]MBD3301220.1 hypothetical protein [Candidatus Eisenbacteria bacterium]